MSHPERIWIGPTYSKLRVLVLGESWYGEFPGDLVTDDAYIRAYLEDRVTDSMYSRMANACELERKEFWNGVMFTNFVQRVGATRDSRPTPEHYKEACNRLARLFEDYSPRGVWILGLEQGKHSAPVVQRFEIACGVSAHPTSYGLKNSTLGASCKALLRKAWPCASTP